MFKGYRRGQKNWLRQRVLAAFSLLFIATPVLAQSQPIPEDLLALDHQRCMNGCVPGFGEQACKVLCDCTVSEFKKKLTFESYLDMSVQLSKNDLTEGVRAFLDTVANYCTAELDRLGIEIGTPEGEGDDSSNDAPPPRPEG